VGNQPLPVICPGATDPSLAKEHIRGDQGIPPDGDGYVPAEETFCSRNPTFTATLAPGETFYYWAIFHNVPSHGQLSLELSHDPPTRSAWLNPWQSPFSAPQPAECPQELVTLGTCVPVSRTPEGKRPNLIVLVHGCCTDENGVREWDGLGGDIAEKIIQDKTSDKWEIVVWDWTRCTSDPNVECTPIPPTFINDVYFKTYADIAYTYAYVEGQKLANTIEKYPTTYEYVHFIGHSAGAKLIHEAATWLAQYKLTKNEKRLFIYLTFLDAYTQNDKDSGKDKDKKGYGNLEGYTNHYSEHYVDRHLPSTDACLASAFNFDISNWKHSPDLIGDPVGHQWPRHWYEKSVTSTSPKFKYGFPLSLDGGNTLNNLISRRDTEFRPGTQCDLDTGLFNENPNPDCRPAACW
jgi:hypothetical protein